MREVLDPIALPNHMLRNIRNPIPYHSRYKMTNDKENINVDLAIEYSLTPYKENM